MKITANSRVQLDEALLLVGGYGLLESTKVDIQVRLCIIRESFFVDLLQSSETQEVLWSPKVELNYSQGTFHKPSFAPETLRPYFYTAENNDRCLFH